MKDKTKVNNIISLSIVFLMVAVVSAPAFQAIDIENMTGMSKGCSYKPIIPVKKTTFVQFDKEKLIDDYAYLASIPTAIFSNDEKLISHPLLYFQAEDTYPDEEKYRFLNDYPGIHYLMEDWMSYCNGRLDQLTTINVDESDLDPDWNTRSHFSIKSEDPFDIASQLAINEWSYSNDAIIAVIEEEYEKPEIEFKGSVTGNLQGEIGTKRFTIKRPYGPASEYEKFTIEDEYKYVKVDLWYPAIVTFKSVITAIPGFQGAVGATFPSIDPDLQVFYHDDKGWVQSAASSHMAITNGPHEEAFSYVYEPGDWRVGVTNMPTEGMDSVISSGPLGKVKIYGSPIDAMKSLLQGVNKFNVDVTKYPGTEIVIPETPEFGCRDGTFELTWDNDNIDLGLTLIGPTGEEIYSVVEKDVDSQKINIHHVGECMEGENYKVVVYALDDVTIPVDFKVKYNWYQNISRKEADLIASACQGAILGSIHNCPLLYVKPNKIPKVTTNAILKLGVENIHLINLGGHLKKEALDELKENCKIKKHCTEYEEVYEEIMATTGSNDVVFSTIDPWTYWYYESTASDLGPAGEYDGAFYFGPASYCAAYHGSPLLLIDNHKELSSAAIYHIDTQQKNPIGNVKPTVACMYKTGNKIYDFLDEHGFDQKGRESIITVAGQYDIGPTWSRNFAGVGEPGAIIGTPSDTASNLVRNLFYQALIYQNPALSPNGVTLINGSKSSRAWGSFKLTDFHPLRGILARLGKSTPKLTNLKIIRPSREEDYKFPVLHTYGCYSHRFNERASKYWGVTYQTRNGYTPGVDISGEEIDQGTRMKFENKPGSFLPDLSDSINGPFYASRAGYSNAFSTDFDITMENLNQGVISWNMVLHGFSGNGGILAWWAPSGNVLIDTVTGSKPYEVNPWRGYDMLWGSTEEPDSATLNSKVGFFTGLTGLGVPDAGPLRSGILKTGMDIVGAALPFPDNLPLLWMFSQRENYFDGLIGPYSFTAFAAKFHFDHPATEVDDKLGNLHSMSFHAGSCLIGCSYLQIAMMRHGAVAQEIDPWVTSYWSGYAGQQTSRGYALGKTVGETFTDGIEEVGVKYIFEDDEDRTWWWDTSENIMMYGDPDLRIFVPNTKYDQLERNNWGIEEIKLLSYDTEFTAEGHMPFGATNHPHEKEMQNFLQKNLFVLIILVLIIILLLIAIGISRKK